MRFKKWILSVVIFIGLFAYSQTPTKESVSKLYVATFNRAPDSAGLNYWIYDSRLSLEGIAKSFFEQPETQALYPLNYSNHEFVKAVYENLFNREPDTKGWSYWESELNNNPDIDRSVFILAVINGALDSDAQILSNKERVGEYFADNGLNDIEKAKEVMKNIDASSDSVQNAIKLIDSWIESEKSDNNTTDDSKTDSNLSDLIDPMEVDKKVESIFGSDDTKLNANLTIDEEHIVGNWYNKKDYTQFVLQLRKDGTFRYKETVILSKFHNVIRGVSYSGRWHLDSANSQVILNIDNDNSSLPDSKLILSNRFPRLFSPSGIAIYPGTNIDIDYSMPIDKSQDIVNIESPSQKVTDILNRELTGKTPNYFTVLAAKANSESFWKAVNLEPQGYSYGHKVYKDSDKQYWEYALKRSEEDPEHYIIVISDESWTDKFGARCNFDKAIQDREKIYRWLIYWKSLMQTLGKVPNRVIHITAGDPPPCFAGTIRKNYDNNASKVPAKLLESRFPEVLELNPSNSFAGIFQTMDYIRKKYAPNVALGYTLKTWGISGFSEDEPSSGWDSSEGVKTMADYLNSFGVDFNILAFNLNPRDGRKDYDSPAYKSYVDYFGAISRKMHTRSGKGAKVWIWKVSTWNRYQTGFYFSHIDLLADSNHGNTIGMTLGHGNDYVKKGSFEDYVRDWIDEYFHSKHIEGVEPHAVEGPTQIESW